MIIKKWVTLYVMSLTRLKLVLVNQCMSLHSGRNHARQQLLTISLSFKVEPLASFQENALNQNNLQRD